LGYNFKISGKDDGQRLDRLLQENLPQQSRKQVKSLLDAGCVLVNGRRVVIAGWEICDGDEVEVRDLRAQARAEPEAQRPGSAPNRTGFVAEARGVSASIDRHLARRKVRRKRDRHAKPEKEPVRVKVYHQDRDIIVVEKPGGLLSVPKEKSGSDDSMLGRVRSYLRRKYAQGKASFVSPLHRLDAETSGVMIFALSKTGQRLTDQFRNHSIQRTYQAVVMGRIERENGVIDRPLEKGDFGEGRKVRSAERGQGMKAITEYRVKERYEEATLVEASVRTGRTHQIRVHFASEGHAILGDNLYAKELEQKYPEVMDEVDRLLGFKRHALHASYIGFKHPAGGRKMTFNSPTPDDMASLIDWLRTK